MSNFHNHAEADLHASAGNPVPADAQCGIVRARDGIALRWARWEPTSAFKGSILLLHGRTESIERYFETVENLRARGFAVVTFDWRGQGGSGRLLSDRRKGHVESFDQYLDDLEAITAEIFLPDCRPPYYMLGHSTGALVALLSAPAMGNRIDRMVLLSPLLALNRLPVQQSTLRAVAGVLTNFGFGRLRALGTRRVEQPRAFEDNAVTSDPERYARNVAIGEAHPHLVIGAPTTAWLFSACRAMEQVTDPDFAAAITVPTLFVAAGSDRVVDSAVVERHARTMRAGTFLTVPGAKHELLMERDAMREQALAAVTAFLGGEAVRPSVDPDIWTESLPS